MVADPRSPQIADSLAEFLGRHAIPAGGGMPDPWKRQGNARIGRCPASTSRLLDDSVRTVVRPDSVQVLDGMLASRLPTSVIGVALHRFAFPSFTVPVVAEEGSAQLLVAVPARR